MVELYFLENLLIYIFEQDLPKSQEQFHTFSLVSSLLEKTRQQLSLVSLSKFLPTTDKTHKSAVEFNTIRVAPQLKYTDLYMFIYQKDVEGNL